MPTTHLQNISIRELKDKKQNPYYLIIDNNKPDEVYFCFSWALKEKWPDLANNWKTLKEFEEDFVKNPLWKTLYQKDLVNSFDKLFSTWIWT